MIHPTLAAAAAGALPPWAEATHRRRAHMARVADLMEQWAIGMGLAAEDVTRWRAAAALHDALRDASPDALRPMVAPELGDLAGLALHGPAAAARLREDGVRDEPVLLAIEWHTFGHPRLDTLGRALYVADHIEPGRDHETLRLAELRGRMPGDMEPVLVEVAAGRLSHGLALRHPIHEASVRFWNQLVATPVAARGGAHG